MSCTTFAANALFGLLAAASHGGMALTSVPMPGGTSGVGAYTLSSVYGQSTSLDTLTAASARLEPGFLCVERSDLGRPGDVNRDGLVNSVDLAVVLTQWGICRPGSCAGDIDRTGMVDSADLGIVLTNWG
jgi:hypothetical protein